MLIVYNTQNIMWVALVCFLFHLSDLVLCMQELNDAPWRVPRTMPGIAYEKKNKKKGKEVEKDVLSYKVDNHFGLPEKANDGKWRCKKNDGKKWLCKRATDERNTLCEYHLGTENSSVEPKEEVLGANAKSAAVKALATSKSAQVRASTNLKLAPMKTSARSKSSVASGSKATSSAIKLPSSSQPRKKKKVGNDWSEEPFLYYDLHTPFRTKRRGSYDNNNGIVEDAANVEKCPQVVTDAGARGQDRPSAEALYMDDIDEISEGDEESDEDYCAPGIGNSEIHAKNGERKVFLPDLNGPKVGTKRL
jgi:hypothetical protein